MSSQTGRRETNRQRLWDRAVGQYGFVTTADALEVGVPAVELPKLAEHGAFSHVAYGLYRFDDMPTSPRDMFAEAVLRVGRGAHLTRDAVLAFHGLALVNPSRVRVGSPRRVRVHLPAWVDVVTENMAADDLTVYDGVPSATVARALVDCRGEVMTERLIDAVAEARGQGLLAAAEADHVLADLRGAQ